MIRVLRTSSNINSDFFILFYFSRLIFYDCNIDDCVWKFDLFISYLIVIGFVFYAYLAKSLFEGKFYSHSLYRMLFIPWLPYLYSSTTDD